MVKRLAERGLVVHRPYRGVSLTRDGLRAALEVIRHHRLLETFLTKELGMPWERVHDEAEVLEHVLSEELEALIAAKLGHPDHDPHGDPIPSADLELVEGDTVSLAALSAGACGAFVRVSDSDPRCCGTSARGGSPRGERFEVVERQPSTARCSSASARTSTPSGGTLAEAMRVDVDGEAPQR
jgi:DtxR family Mn-dependent transcriptional regulator